jgi:cytoskeleton protein RodZ
MGAGDGARSIGEQLRAQREARGESLRDVENATKIRTRYLTALEADDFATLPAEVYALGFLRSYARHLGLDAEGLVRDWRSRVSASAAAAENPEARVPEAPPPSPPPGPPAAAASSSPPSRRERTLARPPAPPRRGAVMGAVIALVVVLAALVYGLQHHHAPAAAAAASSSHAKVHKTHRRRHAHAPAPPALTTTVNTVAQLTMTVQSGTPQIALTFNGDCWVEVWVNGVTSNPSGHTYTTGQTLTLSGQQSVEVRLGNPDVVDATVDGHDLGQVGEGYVRNVLVQTPP